MYTPGPRPRLPNSFWETLGCRCWSSHVISVQKYIGSKNGEVGLCIGNFGKAAVTKWWCRIIASIISFVSQLKHTM